ncbi:LysR family transcriptional regulator [Alphaproteobacteria bacterium KMM 3653]|uniref:LysR family transcriptional regulator n=1 Tax=Harenicola maris TaxID=2841044 RepID=A0AAP2CN13_9RHOB|nr:LysR family transcriptional regulator [Harenicola maris]
MQLESRQIRHLAAIGEHGTFVAAAKALGLSQPALSLSIQRLEDILKVALVERGRNGARLTEPGRLLAQRSQEIDQTMAAVLREIELSTQGIKGKLRIGGTPLATSSTIPMVIAEILKQTPDVEFEIFEQTDEDLIENLDRGLLDIAICAAWQMPEDGPHDFAPLFQAKTVLAMRPDNPLAQHSSLSLDQLQGEMWALPPSGGSFRKQIDALYVTNGWVYPKRMIETSTIATLLKIVRKTDAISLLSRQLIVDELELGLLKCIEIDHQLAPRTFGILTRNDRAMTSLGRLFHDAAIELGRAQG